MSLNFNFQLVYKSYIQLFLGFQSQLNTIHDYCHVLHIQYIKLCSINSLKRNTLFWHTYRNIITLNRNAFVIYLSPAVAKCYPLTGDVCIDYPHFSLLEGIQMHRIYTTE